MILAWEMSTAPAIVSMMPFDLVRTSPMVAATAVTVPAAAGGFHVISAFLERGDELVGVDLFLFLDLSVVGVAGENDRAALYR